MGLNTLKDQVLGISGRRKRDREASTRALLEAGVAVFSELGYDAATTRDVAKRAGVSEGLIQRYFEGKAGLLIAILQTFAEEEGAMALASLPYKKTLEEEFLGILNFICQNHSKYNAFIKVALSRAIVDPKVGAQLRTSVHEKRLPIMVARLGHYQQMGLIPKDSDLDSIAYGISAIGFSVGFMGPQVFGYDEARLKKVAATMSQILGKGIGGK